jgi:nucleoside-diphosphate-sugar epimerase
MGRTYTFPRAIGASPESDPMSSSTSALVLGARGQIGRALLPHLLAAGCEVHAAGRQPLKRGEGHAIGFECGSTGSPRTVVAGRVGQREPVEGIDCGSTGSAPMMIAQRVGSLHFHRLDLHRDADTLPAVDLVFSAGPLDAFAAWFERSTRAPRRVIAFGSTSVHTKQESPDAAERDVASRLQQAEKTLTRECARRQTQLVLLRPTLVYGAGSDRNLTRIATLAKRWGFFVLPRAARGLRQPVHVQDLAAAAWQAANATMSLATAYDLPGGETLPYRDMVARMLACLAPSPKLIELPSAPLRAALWCAHRTHLVGDAGAGVWERLTSDLVFDAQPACRDFGYAPRGFSPCAAMFDASRALLQCTM